MITWTGYDAEPEARLVPEAQCVVCHHPATSIQGADTFKRGVLGMIVMGYWWLDNDGDVVDSGRHDEVWTPPLVVHKGVCGQRWERALKASGGHDLWEDLGDFLTSLVNVTATSAGVPVSRADGVTYLRRHARRVDLRRTADLLDAFVVGADHQPGNGDSVSPYRLPT